MAVMESGKWHLIMALSPTSHAKTSVYSAHCVFIATDTFAESLLHSFECDLFLCPSGFGLDAPATLNPDHMMRLSLWFL
jgi:hypothetical protein